MTWEKVNPDKWAKAPRGRVPHKKLIRRLRAIDVDVLGALFASSGGITGDFNVTGDFTVGDTSGEYTLIRGLNGDLRFYTGDAEVPNYGHLIQGGGGGVTGEPFGFLWLQPPYPDDSGFVRMWSYSSSDENNDGNVGVFFEAWADGTPVEPLDVVCLIADTLGDTASDSDLLRLQLPAGSSSRYLIYSTTNSNHRFSVDGDGAITNRRADLDNTDHNLMAPLYLAMYGPGSNLTVNNTLQTIVFDTNLLDDGYITDSSGVFTLPDPGVYEIHVNVTVETTGTTGGTRGAPTLRVQVDSGGGYAQYGTDQADYIREDANELSAHISWTAPIETTSDDWLLRVRIFDQIATEPTEQVPADGAQITIKRVR